MTFIDQLNNTVLLENYPKRIVSIVPSQTELLHYLELDEEVVGITKFCIHPTHWYKSKTRIGGTKNLNIEKIKQLKPDLIIGNKEENTAAQIAELQKDFPVWMSDIYTLIDAMNMIKQVGEITNRITKATTLISEFEKRNNELKIVSPPLKTAVYLIWNDPLIAAGKNTFIDSMITLAGFDNAIISNRYPTVSIEDIKNLNPDFVFLSTEPFPFKNKHVFHFQKRFTKSTVKIVDGEMFSWYGNRLLKCLDYISNLRNSLQ